MGIGGSEKVGPLSERIQLKADAYQRSGMERWSLRAIVAEVRALEERAQGCALEAFSDMLRQRDTAQAALRLIGTELGLATGHGDTQEDIALEYIGQLRGRLPAAVARELVTLLRGAHSAAHLAASEARERRLREALEKIERWFGEFPPGKPWPDGTPSSYGSSYGSNGERDYMRSIARAALDSTEKKP